MRIKFLSLIVSFLIVSIAVSSCLDSDESYELSSDATIHAFGIDTIHGKYYKFSIDQLNRLIYNKDSLPVGSDTIIDRILIDSMIVTGWITSGLPTDTFFVMTDSVDLLPAMNKSGGEGMKFKAHAADGITVREYLLQVRVHQQDPDSLVWKNMKEEGNVFSNSVTTGPQRSILLNNDLLVYTSHTSVYRTSTEVYKYNWKQATVTNLPADAKLQSVISFQEKLYMATASGDVYSSANGTAWEKVDGLSTQVIALVACFPENDLNDMPATMVGIQKGEDGVNYYCTTSDGLLWSKADVAPNNFPTENIYSTALHTANGVDKVVIVGMPQSIAQQTVPWFSMDGQNWADLGTTSAYCPDLSNPSIMYYGGMFYCLGGKMDAIYTSIAGIAWSKTEKKFLLPKDFEDKGNYSMTIDKNNFIWIVFGGSGTQNEVWRGRLNRLGFKEQ